MLSTVSIVERLEISTASDTWGSDHIPLQINISLEKLHYKKRSFKLYTVRTDWDKFLLKLDKELTKFETCYFTIMNAVDKYNFLIDTITSALKESNPSSYL